MRQLTLEHFQKPLKGEHQQVEAEPDQEFRSLPVGTATNATNAIEELSITPTPPSLRPFVSTPEQPAPRLYSRAELICILTQHLPLNDYKLPTKLYRPDLLDHTMFNDIREKEYQKVLSFLETSEVTVTYHEGYPAIQGNPIWMQLPWEGIEDYQLFQKYLDLPGARQLHLLSDGGRAAALFHTNYWSLRTQASDSFAVAHYQRMREQRVLRSDDKLFLESEALLTRLYRLAPQIEWDHLKTEPDKFVKVLSQLAELQRKSLGLANQSQEPSKAAQPVEVIMRQLTKEEGDATTTAKTITEEGEVDIRDILRHAGDVKSLQELILRVGTK